MCSIIKMYGIHAASRLPYWPRRFWPTCVFHQSPGPSRARQPISSGSLTCTLPFMVAGALPRCLESYETCLSDLSLENKEQTEDVRPLGFLNVVLTISICVVMGVRPAPILMFPTPPSSANCVIYHLLLIFHNWMEATVPYDHVIGCFACAGVRLSPTRVTPPSSNQRPAASSAIGPIGFCGRDLGVFCVAIANGGCSEVAVTLCRTCCSCSGHGRDLSRVCVTNMQIFYQ